MTEHLLAVMSQIAWPLALAIAWLVGELGHRWLALPRISGYGIAGFLMAASQGGFPAATIYDTLRPTGRSMVFDDAQVEGLLDRKFGNGDTFSILALLYPWLEFDQQFHIDHIFPQAMFDEKRLQQLGIPAERWPEWLEHKDDLANLQLLQGLVNQEKSDQDFEAWLLNREREPKGLAHYCDMHHIPPVELDFARFPEFLAARRELLRLRLCEMLQPEATVFEPAQDDLAVEFSSEDASVDPE